MIGRRLYISLTLVRENWFEMERKCSELIQFKARWEYGDVFAIV